MAQSGSKTFENICNNSTEFSYDFCCSFNSKEKNGLETAFQTDKAARFMHLFGRWVIYIYLKNLVEKKIWLTLNAKRKNGQSFDLSTLSWVKISQAGYPNIVHILRPEKLEKKKQKQKFRWNQAHFCVAGLLKNAINKVAPIISNNFFFKKG